jgi:hypothetical protein
VSTREDVCTNTDPGNRLEHETRQPEAKQTQQLTFAASGRSAKERKACPLDGLETAPDDLLSRTPSLSWAFRRSLLSRGA